MSKKVTPVPPSIPSHLEMGVLMHEVVMPAVQPIATQHNLGLTYEKYVADWGVGIMLIKVHTSTAEYSVKTYFDVDYMSYRVQTDIYLIKGVNERGGIHYQNVGTVYTGCYVNEPATLAGRMAEQMIEALNKIATLVPFAV